jgi:phosphoribosylformylglycinamidine synthase
MAFATRCGLSIHLKEASVALDTINIVSLLFNEEIAAVLQIKSDKKEAFLKIAQDNTVIAFEIGHITRSDTANNMISLHNHEGELFYRQKTTYLHRIWDSVSADFTAQRDIANVVLQEANRIERDDYVVPHLHQYLTFKPRSNINVNNNRNQNLAICSPKVAILREQGINSMVEMAYAWTQAGFDAYDVTMTDLIAGRVNLADFQALVACGGFSYGDVLGAGLGWAKSILCNSILRTQFELFFHRPETIALGVCNGCQMMSYLDELMPNTQFPRFTHNASGRYEARVSMLEIVESPSILLKGMAGTRLPVAVAHGEGRIHQRPSNTLVAMRFVDGLGNPTELYPMNPNGSIDGETSVCSPDGRVTLMMPHPERVFRYAQWSWLPDTADIHLPSPWMQLFHNAYAWCNEQTINKVNNNKLITN